MPASVANFADYNHRRISFMGCRIMHDREQNIAALYCSTTDTAFGPVFNDGEQWEADERAEAFLRWMQRSCVKSGDPRALDDSELHTAYSTWLAQEDAQYKRENPEHCQDCGEPVGTCDDDCPSKVKAVRS
jgi:hypothetical protein